MARAGTAAGTSTLKPREEMMNGNQSSNILINTGDDGRTTITLLPLGFRGLARQALYIGGIWTFAVTLLFLSIVWMQFYGYGGVENFSSIMIFSVPFEFFGISVLLIGIQLAKKKSQILIDPQHITIVQHGPLWKSQKRWTREVIKSVDKDDIYDSDTRSHVNRLLIRIQGKWLGRTFFYERPEEEIDKLVIVLRQSLHLSQASR